MNNQACAKKTKTKTKTKQPNKTKKPVSQKILTPDE